jgi:site-specific recombinase XerD
LEHLPTQPAQIGIADIFQHDVLEAATSADEPVPPEAGTPIRPRNLVRQFKELLQKAGLPDTIRFHDIRHFAATTLLSNGADIPTTQAVLGHTDASVTLHFYAQAIPGRTRIVVNDTVNKTFGVKEVEETPALGAAKAQ